MSLSTSHRLRHATTVESRAVLFAAGAFVVGGVVGLFAFGPDPLPIAGPDSLGGVTAILAGIIALVVYVASFLFVPSRRSELPGRFGLRIIDLAALAFAHAAILVLAWSVVFAIVQEAFFEAVLYPLAAAAIAGVCSALSAYFVFLSGARTSTSRAVTLLCTFLVLGVFTAMLTAPNPYWWQMNFSALGAGDAPSSAMFNLTLIVSGLLLAGLTRVLTAEVEDGPLARVEGDDPAVASRRVAQLRIGLVLIGVLLACVGIFPVDFIEPLHIAVASGMLVVWGILVIRLHRIVPGLSRTFLILGYVFFAVIMAAAVAFFTGYYNLTAVELLGFALIFTWLFVLVRNVAAAASDATTTTHKVEKVAA